MSHTSGLRSLFVVIAIVVVVVIIIIALLETVATTTPITMAAITREMIHHTTETIFRTREIRPLDLAPSESPLEAESLAYIYI